MPPERLINDVDGTLWLRIEDAGYLDDEGRVWLVGRVKWMVERNGRRFWSTDVEQKVMGKICVLLVVMWGDWELVYDRGRRGCGLDAGSNSMVAH